MAKVTIRFHETTPQQRRQMLRDLAKRVDINESLEELITTLRQFEDKYGMSTVEFYARFMAGKMATPSSSLSGLATSQSISALSKSISAA